MPYGKRAGGGFQTSWPPLKLVVLGIIAYWGRWWGRKKRDIGGLSVDSCRREGGARNTNVPKGRQLTVWTLVAEKVWPPRPPAMLGAGLSQEGIVAADVDSCRGEGEISHSQGDVGL